ncbi:MAG TPA: undecaprenyl-diphosphate phosphatase [Stellaceae bacterium]|nr:undecaprenyl-diphosphate phosphatase [Stellaceae bacterium]
MNFLQAILFAALQGLTELFPVSSLGHAVILPRLLGWSIDQKSAGFLPFLVVLHLGTAAALLLYFWRDWAELLMALFGIGPPAPRRERRLLLWHIILATIPAVVVGALLEKYLKALFGSPLAASAFLVANGVLLFVGERLRRHNSGRVAQSRTLGEMRWRDALLIGVWQSTALIPGISRSGATMVGGLLRGLRHGEAAHFSFLIATPIIFGAGVREVPALFHGEGAAFGPQAWLAGLVAGITAYASTAFLMRYFGRHDIDSLDPFAWYCAAAGAVSLGLLLFVL